MSSAGSDTASSDSGSSELDEFLQTMLADGNAMVGLIRGWWQGRVQASLAGELQHVSPVLLAAHARHCQQHGSTLLGLAQLRANSRGQEWGKNGLRDVKQRQNGCATPSRLTFASAATVSLLPSLRAVAVSEATDSRDLLLSSAACSSASATLPPFELSTPARLMCLNMPLRVVAVGSAVLLLRPAAAADRSAVLLLHLPAAAGEGPLTPVVAGAAAPPASAGAAARAEPCAASAPPRP
jgi:hypothetical protein